jgi:hypothetical protein
LFFGCATAVHVQQSSTEGGQSREEAVRWIDERLPKLGRFKTSLASARDRGTNDLEQVMEGSIENIT